MRAIALLTCLLLGACVAVPVDPATGAGGGVLGRVPNDAAQPVPVAAGGVPDRLSPRRAVRNFIAVVDQVQPVAEQVCRERAPTFNCDFVILVDDNPESQPNAFQTVDGNGRPLIAFTLPLIAEARNRDEIAFIMAHEAAHHIEGHLVRQRRNAAIGAAVLGNLVGLGGDAARNERAQQIGAALGARTYSKEFELEADALGTVIAARAGYDPLKGADFFFRIPDPGDSFLGTHPANAARLATVRRVAASL